MIAEDQATAGRVGCVPLTIQQASSLLTVPVSTLRSWERRYDVPTTARTSAVCRPSQVPAGMNDRSILSVSIGRSRR